MLARSARARVNLLDASGLTVILMLMLFVEFIPSLGTLRLSN